MEEDCEAAGEGGTLGWNLRGGERMACAIGLDQSLCMMSEMTWRLLLLLLLGSGGEKRKDAAMVSSEITD